MGVWTENVCQESYETDEHMNSPVSQKPEHEASWRRHHMWVLLGRLLSLLSLSKLRTIVAWDLLL